jgi:hypothetical protein
LRVSLDQDGLVLAPIGITLQTQVVGETHHPNVVVCTLGIRLAHPQHFPVAIEVCLVGYGTSPVEAVDQGAQIYVNGVLSTVLEALAGTHDPGLDWISQPEGITWHPVVGPLQVQGAWAGVPDLDQHHLRLLHLLSPLLREQQFHRSFHWVSVYLSRQPDGEFIGECLLDNEPWEAGLALLQADAMRWPHEGKFAGQKQFLLFRRCG